MTQALSDSRAVHTTSCAVHAPARALYMYVSHAYVSQAQAAQARRLDVTSTPRGLWYRLLSCYTT